MLIFAIGVHIWPAMLENHVYIVKMILLFVNAYCFYYILRVISLLIYKSYTLLQW